MKNVLRKSYVPEGRPKAVGVTTAIKGDELRWRKDEELSSKSVSWSRRRIRKGRLRPRPHARSKVDPLHAEPMMVMTLAFFSIFWRRWHYIKVNEVHEYALNIAVTAPLPSHSNPTLNSPPTYNSQRFATPNHQDPPPSPRNLVSNEWIVWSLVYRNCASSRRI